MDFAGQKEQDVLQNKPKFNILAYLYSCLLAYLFFTKRTQFASAHPAGRLFPILYYECQ